jgi:DNA mismatch repair protein MutS2
VEELRRRIEALEREKSHLEQERREFDAWKEKEFEQLTTQHKAEIARVEQKLDRIVKEMSDRASRELEAARDDSVKRYRRKLETVKAQAASEVRREREKFVSGGPQPQVAGQPRTSAKEVSEGSLVRVVSMGVTGSVISIQDGNTEVMVGNIKLRLPLSDLEVVERPSIKLPEGVRISLSSKQLEKNEINLVGCRIDEAIDRADKFLDDAVIAQMTQVRIVHGSGTGALRQAISEFLGSHPHVARFEAAPHAEGGRGVTVVTLRD